MTPWDDPYNPDPNADPNGGGQPPSGPTFDQVNADYQQFLGRALTQQEYQQHWANAPNYTNSLIANSPEGLAYQTQKFQAPKPAPVQNDPNQGGTTSPPPPNLPPGAPGLNDYFNKPFTPPPPVNLGGPKGIEYIPPTPTYTPPSFSPPGQPSAPSPWSYAEYQPGQFAAPSMEEATNSPGYQFRVNQGRDQLEHSAAARGILNSGGTLKGIEDYGQNAASQEYQNVWNRDYNAFNTNEGNRFGAYMANRTGSLQAYNTNYGTQVVDPYQRAYQTFSDTQLAPGMAAFNANVNQGNTAYSTQAQAGQHANDMNYLNDFNLYNFDYNRFRNYQNDIFDRQYKYAQL